MLTKIYPKEIHSQKCHFCKEEMASSTYLQFIYLPIRRTSDYEVTFGKGAIVSRTERLRVEVHIPICEKCKQQDDSNSWCIYKSIFVFFIISLALYIYLLCVDKSFRFNPVTIFAIGLFSCICGLIFGSILNYLIGLFKWNKFDSNAIYSYGPIKKLCNIGFSTYMPSGGILPKTFKTPSDSEIFQTINDIEKEDNCIVS